MLDTIQRLAAASQITEIAATRRLRLDSGPERKRTPSLRSARLRTCPFPHTAYREAARASG
jgi:hypothetical protein